MWDNRFSKALQVGIICLSLFLACNYPGLKKDVAQLSVKELRETLVAQTVAMPGLPTETQEIQFTKQLAGTLASDPTSYRYLAQSGDTIPALAARFGVEAHEIASEQLTPAKALISNGQELIIPKRVAGAPYSEKVLPDSEVINSPTTLGFDVNVTINQYSGYLSHYAESVQGKQLSGSEIIQRVAMESSVTPRFLLALLELRSGWVRNLPGARIGDKYPIGFRVGGWEGLYREMVITATHLNAGYYGWREGSLTETKFQDGRMSRLSPELNAGSIAVQNLLAKLYPQDRWQAGLYGDGGLLEIYQQMFGDPWVRAADMGPLFPNGISQPTLELPFALGKRWSLTGGPHPSWKTGSPRGALDLAPVTGEAQCEVSRVWVTASAAGVVARSERNVVAIDLDGDGYEQTGWVIIYMHIADKERIAAGVYVKLDDSLGHPSCEGGTSTGTHVHIARKYNGEWIAADGPLPFVLSGWEAFAEEKNYQGGMRKGEQEVVASPVGPRTSIIVR